MRLVWRLTRLIITLWFTLVLVMGSVMIWRLNTVTGETACLRFANSGNYQQSVYPTLLDANRSLAVSFPKRAVPDAVFTASDNGQYRIRQTFHLKRVFSIPASASVETLGTGKIINLPAAISNNSVFWSPDGSQFAYYSVDKSTAPDRFSLVLANADGSDSILIPLTDFNLIHYVSWSPDSQYLLVASYFDAWLIRAADKQIQVITGHKELETMDAFQWSPRGHLLAYLWAETQIPNHVIILDPDSAANLRNYVRADKKYWWSGRLLWSDDLHYVAAVGWVDGLIDVVGVDGSAASLNNVGTDQQSLASMWIPATDRFIFMTTKNELTAYDAAADRYQSLATDTGVHVETIGNEHDLIFTQKQADGTTALFKLDTRNNQQSVLMTAQAKGWLTQYYLLPSRDKALTVLWENEAIDVYLLDLKSGERRQLASGMNNFAMQSNPSDPETFMFFWMQSRIAARMGWDIYDLTGTRRYQFQVDGASLTGLYDGGQFVPFWSPDHRYAVFTNTDPELYKGLVVASSDGQQAWQIPEAVWGVDFDHILWSADSSKVALVVNIHGAATLLVYTAGGKLLAKTKMPLSSDYFQWTTCEI